MKKHADESLSLSVFLNDGTLNIKYHRLDPHSPTRARIIEQLEDEGARVNWSSIYIALISELVSEWDLMYSEGEPVPITPEGLYKVPIYILREVVFSIVKAENLFDPNLLPH